MPGGREVKEGRNWGSAFVPRKLNLKIGRRLRALGLPRYDTLRFAFVFVIVETGLFSKPATVVIIKYASVELCLDYASLSSQLAKNTIGKIIIIILM